MRWQYVNLFMMVFWLGLGLGLLFLYPEEEKTENLNLIAYLALALALWNFIRWWAQLSMTFSRDTLEQDRLRRQEKMLEDRDKPVTNPEFDFDSPRRPGPPPDSANGETR